MSVRRSSIASCTVFGLGLVASMAVSRAAFAQAPADAPPPPPASGPSQVPTTTAPTTTTPAETATAPAPSVTVTTTAAPATSPSVGAVDVVSLRVMRDKGLITQAEYESALKDLGESIGARAADASSLVLGKWSTTMYGFVEADSILDNTRSFNDIAGNGQVKRPGTTAAENSRFTESVRNSRIGFRLRAPEYHGIRTSAQLEMDFLGNQPTDASEGAFFTNPTFRIRHFNFKMETPVVDVMFGQYWQLFGWQSVYHPNTVEIQGVPGQVYSRTPQIRVSKSIKTEALTLELAVAATRPVQRDSGMPDFQGGLRVAFEKWTGTQTMGATGTTISPLSVAVTGYQRHVNVEEFSAAPKTDNDKWANGVAVDAFIPVIPGTKEKKGNSLSLNGEYASGYGDADMYTGLNGGAGYPALPAPAGGGAAPVYAPNIDGGIVTYDAGGTLHYIQWTSYLVGLQYYFPGLDGRAWLSANYSHHESNNISNFGGAAGKQRLGEDWYDLNLFADVTPAVRLGLEGAVFDDQYKDGQHARNYRYQFSAFYLF